jgi:hypothetical protein
MTTDDTWARALVLPERLIARARRLLAETRGVTLDDVLGPPPDDPPPPPTPWLVTIGVRIDEAGRVSCVFCDGPIATHADGRYCATPCAQARQRVEDPFG